MSEHEYIGTEYQGMVYGNAKSEHKDETETRYRVEGTVMVGDGPIAHATFGGVCFHLPACNSVRSGSRVILEYDMRQLPEKCCCRCNWATHAHDDVYSCHSNRSGVRGNTDMIGDLWENDGILVHERYGCSEFRVREP